MSLLTLPVRQYCGVPSGRPVGLVERVLNVDAREVGFVELHCWNVGFPEGPPVPEAYWVAMGSPRNHALAAQIVREGIAPALEAARAAGLAILHVQPQRVCERYPQARYLADPPAPSAGSSVPEPLPGYRQARADAVHGAGYHAWDGWQRLDIPALLRPRPDEYVVATTAQVDRICRARGITTLVYTGFATNLCILDSPGAMKPMHALGYRCILLRECTLAVEFEDTIDARLNTQVALRYIEAWVGYTAALADWRAACQAAGGAVQHG